MPGQKPDLERVAPNTDDVGRARNALSLIDARMPREALGLVMTVEKSNPFSELVRGFAMHDIDLADPEAAQTALAAVREAPGIMRHLIPWRANDRLEPHLEVGYRKQIVISLRLFRRYDINGWLARLAHADGIRHMDGTALLVDVDPAAKPPEGHDLCLIDGAHVRSLSAHVARYNVSPKAYREFFNLPKAR